jgi:metal-responsive CopG/Arc/MetJ family transcriptional regulator
MENVQNISGADAVTAGFSVRSEVVQEAAGTYEDERAHENRVPEENKGVHIDTYA